MQLFIFLTGVGSSADEETVSPPAEKETGAIWAREVAAGYNKTTGNTRDSQISVRALINKNRKHIDELTLKGDAYYSSAGRKMNAQKWHGLARYAFSFSRRKNWYNFYRLEADHDRFAGIDYRLVPAAGVGYWFYDLPELKLMAEVGAGIEHTDFRGNAKDKNEGVLAPRAFFEKQIFNNSTLTQNLYCYPAFEDFDIYRLRSETALTVSMNEKFSIRISLIDDYNSNPPGDTKKNDVLLISSLAYSF